MPKNDYVKLVIDARTLNSVTDLASFSWPLEPVRMIMTRVNGKVFSVGDLSCACHQVPLSPEQKKLTSFIIGGKQYTYTRGFYGLCGLPNFYSRLMTMNFDTLIKKKQAITYIDDTIMQSQNKNEMFTVVNEYHTLLREAGLKAAPDKTLFFLKKNQVVWSRYIPRRNPTYCKTSKRLEKSQITRIQTRCHESSWMHEILQLLYQGPPCRQSALLRRDWGLDSFSLDTWTRKTISINQGQN